MSMLSDIAVTEDIRIRSGCVTADLKTDLPNLRIKIYADGADKSAILALYDNPLIKGFTTNPTLMRKSGISEYCDFARGILDAIPDRPISFEVIADEFAEMER